MKPVSKALFAAALLTLSTFAAKAQTANDFFIDNYAFKYRYNPAMPSEKSFFSIGAGAVDLGLKSNIGLSSFLFPTDNGKLVTGLHPSISGDTFIGGLPDIAAINANLNECLFAIGSWSSKGFTTFEVNLRGGMDFQLPKGFFEFAKLGGQDKVYDMSNLGLSANAYLELALGRTLSFSDRLAIGFRVKGLLGLASASAGADKLTLAAGKTALAANADASMRLALKGVVLSTNPDGHYDLQSRPSIEGDNLGLSGLGVGIDLGATYKLGPLTFSAAILDLGFMKWNYNITGNGTGSFSFNGLEDLDVNSSTSQDNALKDAMDDLLKVVEFTPGEEFGESAKLNMTANAGVTFTPINLISLGVTGMMKTGVSGTFVDARAGATINPLPCFSLSGNIGRNSLGGVCGGALSLNLAMLNVYASVDGYLGSVMPKYYIPIDPFCMNAKLGVVLVFGKRHSEFR